MGNVISGLFGGKPKKPKLVVTPTPIEKIQQQTNIADETTRKRLAKLRRATMLSQQELGQKNIQVQKLGAV